MLNHRSEGKRETRPQSTVAADCRFPLQRPLSVLSRVLTADARPHQPLTSSLTAFTVELGPAEIWAL